MKNNMRTFTGGDNNGRTGADFYPTPLVHIQAIIPFLEDSEKFHDPCAGQGNIARVLKDFNVYQTDLNKWTENLDIITDIDFLQQPPTQRTIICSPPYNIATSFITHALSISTDVIMHLPIRYVCGKKRLRIFKEFSPYRIIVLQRDNPRSMLDMCWIIWRPKMFGFTQMIWSDI